MKVGNLDGFSYHPEALSRQQQQDLVAWAFDVARGFPWYTPAMPRTGTPMSVKMTSAGRFAWMSDKLGGYRYEPSHPVTGRPLPPIHPLLRELWQSAGQYAPEPESCLINWYGPTAKMGQHVDKDEDDPHAPVVSLSLGDEGIFRLGGLKRGGPTTKLTLKSGDVVVLGGTARFAYHGVDRIRAGSSQLVPGGGRLNMTLRRVTKPS